MTSITIELSDDLAARAQRAGVLRSAFVNALIEEATTYAAARNLTRNTNLERQLHNPK